MEGNKLSLNLDKCLYLASEVTFLGFIINGKEIQVNPKKIRIVGEWPTLTNIHEGVFMILPHSGVDLFKISVQSLHLLQIASKREDFLEAPHKKVVSSS